jgi:hypothetical protein
VVIQEVLLSNHGSDDAADILHRGSKGSINLDSDLLGKRQHNLQSTNRQLASGRKKTTKKLQQERQKAMHKVVTE